MDIIQLSQKAEARMVDVLSFVDVRRTMLGGEEVGGFSRQVAVNGELLADPEDYSSLLHPEISVRTRRTYLRQLLGERTSDELDDGRTPLGYCPACLGNDGWIFACSLTIDPTTVRWSRVGVDEEYLGPSMRGPWWRRIPDPTAAPEGRWIVEPDDPALIYTFDRSDYERVIRAEIERLGKA